jgi:hypothetical protein
LALPLEEVTPSEVAEIPDDILALVRASSERLVDLLTTYNNYRDYYENEQPLKYASDEFNRAFGLQFEDLKANFCEVVVDAMEERIGLDRIIFRKPPSDDNEDTELTEVSTAIWDALHLNEFEAMENELYNSALVEGTAAVIVWPDEELGARVDANKAQNVLVHYNPDNPREVTHALKRWMTEAGELRVTLYTPEALWKLKVPPISSASDHPDDVRRPTADMRERETEGQQGWLPRLPAETGDPEWPLPNPFGEVPVVEFPGRRGRSELLNITPLQDLLNKTLADMSVAGEYSALRQKYVVTSNEEPEGGWKSVPGNVWHLTPEVDVEGRPLPTQVGTLEETPPDTYIKIIETVLQLTAHIGKTPTYYFFSTTKSGGRGDAPSGEALRVTETALIKKVEKVEEPWTRSWLRVGRLINMALSISNDATPVPLPLRGEVTWTHAQSHFMTTLLEEAARMIQEVGLPPEFGWRHIGLTEGQIKEALAWREKNLPEGIVVTRQNVEVGEGADNQDSNE